MDKNMFLNTIQEYKELGMSNLIDYDKFYLYSIVTHSTAIEGSTMTEVENQVLFEEGLAARGKSMEELNMNLDLKAAYERSMELAKGHTPISLGVLKHLSSIVMRRTGREYSTLSGSFDSSRGDLRKVNVTAGVGGKFYMNWEKIEDWTKALCADLETQRKNLIIKPDVFEAYMMSFDAHNRLVQIHPWVDGNGRMSRLLMNHIQFEFDLVPTIVKKEDKADYIQALVNSREQKSLKPFREFMMEEHVKNLKEEIKNYNLSLGDDSMEETVSQHMHR